MSNFETSISLCLIVRNEAARLPRCIESARPAVDEIVVVDTGSTDGTQQVAARLGARVSEFPWVDDFSAARNASLERSRMAWALVLDADETLQEGGAERIRQAVRDDEASGYFLHFVSPLEGGETSRFLIVRLFRRAPGVFFENVIHEQVTTSLNAWWKPRGKKLKLLDLLVHHDGYREEIFQSRGKEARNLALFEKQLRLHPHDPYSWYKYGDFLRHARHKDKALAALKRAFDLLVTLPIDEIQALPFSGEIVTLLALELHERGADEEAFGLLQETSAIQPCTANRTYVYGGLALRTGRLEAARQAFERCLTLRDEPEFVARRDGVTGHLALTGLAAVAARMGRLEEGCELYSRALRMNPRHGPAATALATVLMLAGRTAEAVRVLEEYLREVPRDPHAWLRGASALLRLGQPERAFHWTERAREAGASPVGLARLRGAVHLAMGRPCAAVQAFECFPADEECRAGLWLARVLEGLPRLDALEEEDRAESAGVKALIEVLGAAGRWSEVEKLAARCRSLGGVLKTAGGRPARGGP
ncbi:MAG: glycosyltransferase [Planctomycetota bacterium]